MKIVLASNSPRRRELLKNAGVDFVVIPSDYAEPKYNDLPPCEYAKELAYGKANAVYNKHGGVVIGADTIVVLNGKVLGKPKGKADAVSMLKSLSNNVHEVITGYAIISEKGVKKGFEVTKVLFNNLSDKTILDYVASGSPLDKAGAYGIQDGWNLVKDIQGDYDNVVGLPTGKIIQLLKEFL